MLIIAIGLLLAGFACGVVVTLALVSHQPANRVKRYPQPVPGADNRWHVSDGKGGTLCGERFSDTHPNELCRVCETRKTLVYG